MTIDKKVKLLTPDEIVFKGRIELNKAARGYIGEGNIKDANLIMTCLQNDLACYKPLVNGELWATAFQKYEETHDLYNQKFPPLS